MTLFEIGDYVWVKQFIGCEETAPCIVIGRNIEKERYDVASTVRAGYMWLGVPKWYLKLANDDEDAEITVKGMKI